jgi:hypothetical protein
VRDSQGVGSPLQSRPTPFQFKTGHTRANGQYPGQATLRTSDKRLPPSSVQTRSGRPSPGIPTREGSRRDVNISKQIVYRFFAEEKCVRHFSSA